MKEKKKTELFYLSIGYGVILMLLLASIKFLLVDDYIGNFLIVVSILCMGSIIRYFERILLPESKESRIIKAVFIGCIILIGLGGLLILF
ncbi:hypothetical protein CEH05_08590 [Halobacillus halophilus]|uniref:Uncharacterized protein n=1 Tax=Halobacillus halophilus (strain ATCC 35676 / DSM 2266 / JCM 20832 / KCTC 3685 / LMG 17431 / NBRC 102448 / NCIMB 2269) TaxID=866895 RepID=I0JLP8_HALH3|nr:hypothetical protein [Halobacillus halophilus]ASF39173.1 hypothetical protein CEH05_08590 [Halobacillus halophilus]CCG45068.1 hypothetical protein HBHAL_2719 [Halobacillus halophilus DSM 2266]